MARTLTLTVPETYTDPEWTEALEDVRFVINHGTAAGYLTERQRTMIEDLLDAAARATHEPTEYVDAGSPSDP